MISCKKDVGLVDIGFRFLFCYYIFKWRYKEY